MRLAILMTNTDETAFAQARPKDGQKFSDLVHEQRPDWQCDVYSVKDGVFPHDLDGYDGVMITGSPASVHEQSPWVSRLFDLIREIDTAELPMYGACFGHQAIAMALGGKVSRNPQGWVHGYIETEATEELPWLKVPEKVGLYASHIEQVSELPAKARAVVRGPDCPVGGFVKGRHIYTTQYHPEMSDSFIADLVEFTESYVGREVTEKARASLQNRADRDIAGKQIVSFFEWATAQRT